MVKYPSMNACLSAALKIEKYVEAVFRDIVPFLLPPQGADNKKNLKSSANLLSICEKSSVSPANIFNKACTRSQFVRIEKELLQCRLSATLSKYLMKFCCNRSFCSACAVSVSLYKLALSYSRCRSFLTLSA